MAISIDFYLNGQKITTNSFDTIKRQLTFTLVNLSTESFSGYIKKNSKNIGEVKYDGTSFNSFFYAGTNTLYVDNGDIIEVVVDSPSYNKSVTINRLELQYGITYSKLLKDLQFGELSSIDKKGLLSTFLSNIGVSDWKISLSLNVKNITFYTRNELEIPPQQALFYSNTDDVTQAIEEKVPPTFKDIFNSWARIDGANYFASASEATGEAADWYFDDELNSFVQPNNTSKGNAFISPDTYDKYTLECTVTSTGTDDDLIGLIVAYVRDGDVNKCLIAARTQGGCEPSNGWGLIYVEDGNWTPTKIYSNISVGGTNKNGDDGTGDGKGWNGRESRIKIIRDGDDITAYCTEWNDTGNYSVTSETKLNLNDYSELSVFKGQKPYGYYTESQAYSTYKDSNIIGGLNQNSIYSLSDGKLYVYNFETSSWEESVLTPQEIYGYPTTITNPETGETFKITETEVIKL